MRLMLNYKSKNASRVETGKIVYHLVEPDFLNDGCTAQWTFNEAGLAFPTRANVTTGKKDDVALQTNKKKIREPQSL